MGVGPAAEVAIPDGFRVLEAEVVTPGLIDAHATVGLTGIFNQRHDQDVLERSHPIQPELRALDAYNPHERLVEFVRSFGVTTVHTGHAPGELISGQTIIVKTRGNTVEEALVLEPGAVAVTLSPMAEKDGQAPGTRGKIMAMLRAELIKAREYVDKHERWAAKRAEGAVEGPAGGEGPNDGAEDDGGGPPERNLRYEMLGRVLKGQVPL